MLSFGGPDSHPGNDLPFSSNKSTPTFYFSFRDGVVVRQAALRISRIEDIPFLSGARTIGSFFPS